MRVKRIFVFDRTNHNRNESRRDFRRATRPIHRHRADEWEKAPAMGAFGTLVGNTRLSARGVRAFSRRSAERSRTCGYVTATVLSVILRVRNFIICDSIYYTSFGRGCQTTTARAKEKINAKKSRPLSDLAESGRLTSFNVCTCFLTSFFKPCSLTAAATRARIALKSVRR